MSANHEQSQTSVGELREYFNKHYGFISLELDDRELANFLERPYLQGCKVATVADCLSDYILSQGLGEVQE